MKTYQAAYTAQHAGGEACGDCTRRGIQPVPLADTTHVRRARRSICNRLDKVLVTTSPTSGIGLRHSFLLGIKAGRVSQDVISERDVLTYEVVALCQDTRVGLSVNSMSGDTVEVVYRETCKVTVDGDTRCIDLLLTMWTCWL